MKRVLLALSLTAVLAAPAFAASASPALHPATAAVAAPADSGLFVPLAPPLPSFLATSAAADRTATQAGVLSHPCPQIGPTCCGVLRGPDGCFYCTDYSCF